MRGNDMNIAQLLLGTSWELVKYQSENTEGDIIYPLGKDALGIIVFTKQKRVSVQIMATEFIDSRLFLTDVEKKMAAFGYHAYSGFFVIDEDKQHLITSVDMSLIDAYVGSIQTRSIKIEDDLLYLSNVNHPERKLVWRRIMR